MNVSLVMVQSDGTSKEVPVGSLPVVVGRDEGVKLRIPKPNISRRHCELSVNDDDELVVRDLKSSNGTYVNGERVRERELVPGDLLTIGDMVFVVRIDGYPKDIDAADSYAAGSVMLGGTPVASSGGNGPKTEMISGVPTWGGASAEKKPAAPAPAAASPAMPAPAPAAAKPKKADDDDFSDLLEGLDIDDDEEDFPRKKT